MCEENEIFVCKFCNKECKNDNSLRNHERLCKLNPNKQISYIEKYNQEIKNGNKQRWNKWLTKYTDDRIRKSIETHKQHLNDGTVKPSLLGKHLSEDAKARRSKSMKDFLLNNPDKHPWRKSTKFISTPCEDLKDFLRSKGYSFEEEAIIIKDRNFSVDICFKDIALVIEVNGFQHYIKDSFQLKPYYQNRHEIIESAGWNIIEIPCKESYTDKFRTYLCNIIDSRCSDESIIEKANSFYIKTHTELLLERHKRNIDNIAKFDLAKEHGKVVNNRIIANKLSYEDIEHRKQLILNSGVDLTKFGWVSKVSAVTKLTKREIYCTVEKCEDLKSMVFRRK